MLRVAKFGGTSLANGAQIKKVIGIIKKDPCRRAIVVSAPGKRHPRDQKITDLLLRISDHNHTRNDLHEIGYVDMITVRFEEIVKELGLEIDIKQIFGDILEKVSKLGPLLAREYLASRGEYLNAIIIAKALGFEFIDADEFIHLDEKGRYDQKRTANAAQKIGLVEKVEKGIVVPGFYGIDAQENIRTFPRGGSDITGAIVSAVLHADMYENWTDKPGVLMTDPSIVPDARTISQMNYSELRELTYMGANVFQDEAVFPVRELDIPINVRDTNNPGHPGTLIVAKSNDEPNNLCPITGIAGRKNFTVISMSRALMNQEIGFVRRVCSIMEEEGVSFEHMPTSIDSLSIIISGDQFAGKETLPSRIDQEMRPDGLVTQHGISLICVVGRAMVHIPGIAGRVFGALGQAKINDKIINQGSSETNIIIGVSDSDFENATRVIYNEFVV